MAKIMLGQSLPVDGNKNGIPDCKENLAITTGSSCIILGEQKVINDEYHVCADKGDGPKWWLAINSGCTMDGQCTKDAICKNNLCKLVDGAGCIGPSGASVGASCASGSCVDGNLWWSSFNSV